MLTFNSNVDSPPVSATASELPVQKHIIGEDSGLEIVISNVDTPSISATSGVLQNPANIVQSNASRGGFSSAISRLPTEVLSEIFLYCLPEDKHLTPTPGLAPLLLTTICQRWRKVAMGFPKLWRTLRFTMEHNDLQKRGFCYDLWLKRSGGCPLSLTIDCFNVNSKLQILLQPYAQQISSLTLYFVACRDPFMMEDFHALKELTIDGIRLDEEYVYRSLSKLPVNLRRMNLAGPSFDRKRLDSFTDCGWAGLTHVEIIVDGLDAFPQLLRLCPNLSSVSVLAMSLRWSHLIQTPESVTHTNLQSLRLAGEVLSNSDGNFGLFEVITLPNLRVVDARDIGPWPHEEFKTFLRRSKCPMERLIFRKGVILTERQRTEYATLVPSVEFSDILALYQFIEHQIHISDTAT